MAPCFAGYTLWDTAPTSKKVGVRCAHCSALSWGRPWEVRGRGVGGPGGGYLAYPPAVDLRGARSWIGQQENGTSVIVR